MDVISSRRGNPLFTNFFEELPSELILLVLGYMTAADGRRLMQVNKSLQGRIAHMVKKNHREFLTSLYDKVLDYFSFFPREYLEQVRKKGKKALEKALLAESLEEMDKACEILGKKFFKSRELGRACRLFPEKEGIVVPFFPSPQERVPAMLIEIGKEIAVRCKVSEEEIEQASQKAEDETGRQIYLSITCEPRICRIPDAKGQLDRISQITDEKRKEEGMLDFLKRFSVDPADNFGFPEDPFIRTEECFSRLDSKAKMHYMLTGYMNRHQDEKKLFLLFLDQVVNHPNRSVKKENLFIFFDCFTWLILSHLTGDFETIRQQVYEKSEKLIAKFAEEEGNVGVFCVIKEFMRLFLENGEEYNSLIKLARHKYRCRGLFGISLAYLKERVQKKEYSQRDLIEVGCRIFNQCDYWGRRDYRLDEFLKVVHKRAVKMANQPSEIPPILTYMAARIGMDTAKLVSIITGNS